MIHSCIILNEYHLSQCWYMGRFNKFLLDVAVRLYYSIKSTFNLQVFEQQFITITLGKRPHCNSTLTYFVYHFIIKWLRDLWLSYKKQVLWVVQITFIRENWTPFSSKLVHKLYSYPYICVYIHIYAICTALRL